VPIAVNLPLPLKLVVQTPVGVVTHERELVRAPDSCISRDYNLPVALRCHALAVGAALSSDGWIAEGRERNAGMDDAEPDGTFHFLKLEGLIKNQKLSAKNFSCHSYVALSDERRSPAPLSLGVMAAIASCLQTFPLHKPAAVLRGQR
jgi:hypothetical protein